MPYESYEGMILVDFYFKFLVPPQRDRESAKCLFPPNSFSCHRRKNRRTRLEYWSQKEKLCCLLHHKVSILPTSSQIIWFESRKFECIVGFLILKSKITMTTYNTAARLTGRGFFCPPKNARISGLFMIGPLTGYCAQRVWDRPKIDQISGSN